MQIFKTLNNIKNSLENIAPLSDFSDNSILNDTINYLDYYILFYPKSAISYLHRIAMNIKYLYSKYPNSYILDIACIGVNQVLTSLDPPPGTVIVEEQDDSEDAAIIFNVKNKD